MMVSARHPNAHRYRRSKRHELRLARLLGGRRLPNSGGARMSRWDRTASQGGDIEDRDRLYEHKGTNCASISVKREWIDKVMEGAARRGKMPALLLTFERMSEEPLDLVVLRLEDYLHLTGTGAAE